MTLSPSLEVIRRDEFTGYVTTFRPLPGINPLIIPVQGETAEDIGMREENKRLGRSRGSHLHRGRSEGDGRNREKE